MGAVRVDGERMEEERKVIHRVPEVPSNLSAVVAPMASYIFAGKLPLTRAAALVTCENRLHYDRTAHGYRECFIN